MHLRETVAKFSDYDWQPRQPCYALATMIGEMLYILWPRARHNMKHAAAAISGADIQSPSVRRTARHSLYNFCRYIVDFVCHIFPGGNLSNDKFRIAGLYRLNEGLQSGKGVILVSFNLGNFDLGAKMLGQLGYTVNAVVNPIAFTVFDRFVCRCRRKSRIRLLPASDGLAPELAALGRNEVVMLMLDSPTRSHYVEVEFGGRIARVSTLAATLARRSGANICTGRIVKLHDGTYQGSINAGCPPSTAGLSRSTGEMTAQMFRQMAREVQLHLEQWYVYHPLFLEAGNVGFSLNHHEAEHPFDISPTEAVTIYITREL